MLMIKLFQRSFLYESIFLSFCIDQQLDYQLIANKHNFHLLTKPRLNTPLIAS